MKVVHYSPEPALRHPHVLLGEMFQSIWAARELAWRLMVRNLSAMYRQTILGYVWAFLPPLVAAGTFIVLRRGGALTVNETAVDYVPWVVAGTFLWQVFADAVTAPMRQVSQAKPMLAKINFPREALILAGTGETLANFLVRLIILIPVLAFYQINPGLGILWFFPLLLLLVAMGNVIGIFITPPAILYQDFEKGIPLMLPFLMILSGAVIPAPTEGLAADLAALNPLYPVLESARCALLGQPITHGLVASIYAACTVVLIVCGWVLYRVAMPHLIARIPS